MPFIVSWTVGESTGDPNCKDHYQIFCDSDDKTNKREASKLFNRLRNDFTVVTAQMSKIIKSTDAVHLGKGTDELQ